MDIHTRLVLAVDFVIPISSTSLPGGNLVDGLPPAASFCFGGHSGKGSKLKSSIFEQL